MHSDATRQEHIRSILERVRTRPRGGRALMTVSELLAWESRLPGGGVRVVAAVPADIPALVTLISTRKPSVPAVPLKFIRTPDLLARTWPHVHWLLARGPDGRLLGCIELRPVEGEDRVWEIGSFSQAADNANPRVPVRLWVAAFRALRELEALAAVVEIHARNDAMWAFLARLPFEPDARPASHPEFARYRLTLN